MFAKQHTIVLAVAALFGVSVAHAASGWVATRTQAAQPQKALIGAMARDVGEATAGQTVRVAVSLKLRNKPQLDALTAGILRGAVKRRLSHAEFMSQYAPTEAQAQAVVRHLQASGFRNVKVAPNRLLITADGSAATVKTAFNTPLHRYSVNGRSLYANTAAAMVPGHLGDIVLSVQGLQNMHQFHTTLARSAAAKGVPHSPTDFSTIYNADSLPPASGTTVGIIAEGDLSQTLSDLQAFTSGTGFNAVNTKVINAGNPSSDIDGTVEWNLDSQDIIAAAGGAVQQMNFYVASSMGNADITAALNSAVSDNAAKVVNVSLGECESNSQSDGSTAADDQIFQSAVAQGQIFSVSTGDSGSAECGSGATGQSYPAVSPYVVAVGGTTLITSGDTGYQSERTWNGGGGGPSTTESAPSWQSASGVLSVNPGQRGVPDVSFDADPASGANVLVNGSTQPVGGTSLAAPLFTGFWARIESANGNQLGYPAPSFYKYFQANPSLYNDVVDGSNGDYSAGPGWDYATGWGSLNIAKLNAFIGQTPGF
ncbi:peptidase S53 [Chromobacterium sp. ATCC 53434]|uniref:S53 family peptidase n=1 Tax=Chromobacterium sp. (strain ATCC 53434 / SC 14030) TaxID=2059672 RepID=UPI000C7603B8|nr:S53 family peptidase [Chromobacterium sp. ATCC 53434]AUH51009.1 peptidase S53 [Chromobacterium sp. ATCC 53434]